MIQPKLDQSTLAPTVGIFGKVPGCAEFIRYNMAGESGRRILQWLGPIWDQAREMPVFFSLHDGGPTVTYGRCQPSLDRLGRVAPLVQFVEAQSGCPAELLRLLKPHAGIRLERPEVRQRWARYTQCAWAMRLIKLGAQEQRRLRTLTTSELLNELETTVCLSVRDYAFATLWQACLRAIGSSATPFRLELPVHSDRTHSFWQYFLHHLLDLSPMSTKLLWWHDKGRSLVLQTGVRAPEHRLWRLKTAGEEARIRVSTTLPPTWKTLLDRRQNSAQTLADSMLEIFDRNERERL